MGYYATGTGTIILKPDADAEKIKKILADAPFESDYDEQNHYIDVWNNEKYYDDEVAKSLKKLAPYTESGDFDFLGEDGQIWRYVYQDNGMFIDESGEVVYESDKRAQGRRNYALTRILEEYVNLGSGGDMLEYAYAHGLENDDLKYLGFSYLLDTMEG